MAQKKYAMIVDSEVFAVFMFDTADIESNPNVARIIAGMSSNPTAVDASDVEGIAWGWTYDGTTFTQPSE